MMTVTRGFAVRALAVLMVCALLLPSNVVPASAASVNYAITETEINDIIKAFDDHGWVLKENFWANTSSTGRRAIRGVQKLLCFVGYETDIDGSVGPHMSSCIYKFQKETKGLTPDRIVGRQTFNSLVAAARAKLKDNQSVRVSIVNDMKSTLIGNAKNSKTTLNECLTVSGEILASKQVLRSLGLAAGSVSSGFLTAGWNVCTDSELLVTLAQLEIAHYAANKASKSADIVLSYSNKSLDENSSIALMKAYRDFSAWYQAAVQTLQPILNEYAQHGEKSKGEKAAILSEYFLEGAFDGVLGGLNNIDQTADKLLKLREQSGNISSFAETVLPILPAYDSYRDTFKRWQNTIAKLEAL